MPQQKMFAVIRWIPKDQGGRIVPPQGTGTPPYATLLNFTDNGETWPSDESWSLVVEKQSAGAVKLEWIAHVHFLASEAPHHLLRAGRTFDLFEGKKCVAQGFICG